MDRLWKSPPETLAREALTVGRYRERRMVLQAKEATTNRRLAWVATAAACVALFVPFVQRFADSL